MQVSLGLAVNDVDGDWIRCREIDDKGCILVRPDRIIAWSSPPERHHPIAVVADSRYGDPRLAGGLR